jgi:transglutaminase-like putative cysteine protease
VSPPPYVDGTRQRALLMVRHRTRLCYAEPVYEAHSEVRKTPIDTGLQRVITTKLSVDPYARPGEHRDWFGNVVHHFNLLEPHGSVTVTAESVVETTDAVCCGPEALPDPRPWQQRWAEFLHPSPAVPPLAEYASLRHDVGVDQPPERFVASLAALGSAFTRRFDYDTTSTDVHSSPAVLFEHGGGVCQDFAHAMLGVLRLAGIPSRYASGYVYDGEQDADAERVKGAAASHAWVQAWHPELGWVGVDPTNDKLVDWQYVRVAVGRDYSDVRPLHGVFTGRAGQELEVEVQVKRLDGGWKTHLR